MGMRALLDIPPLLGGATEVFDRLPDEFYAYPRALSLAPEIPERKGKAKAGRRSIQFQRTPSSPWAYHTHFSPISSNFPNFGEIIGWFG
ncbi:MAG: hypothetical protein LBU64_01735 [Planctomycetota bacterium]|jgi:hypothetical protein|nr:hypothetical protein [Planctomycetota bacterium]